MAIKNKKVFGNEPQKTKFHMREFRKGKARKQSLQLSRLTLITTVWLGLPHCHAQTQMVLNSGLPMVRGGSGWVLAELE